MEFQDEDDAAWILSAGTATATAMAMMAVMPRGMFAQSGAAAAGSGFLPETMLAGDPQRPQFHLLPARNWMNDPNGPIYIPGANGGAGTYHMFFQYNPLAAVWGDMSWDHAVSNDMLHWRHEPVAMTPTPGSVDAFGVFSGSAIAVMHGKARRVYAVYTGTQKSDDAHATIRDGANDVQEQQCLAWSDDAGLVRWTKDPKAIVPVPPEGMKITGFRDPSVWRSGGWYYMTVGSGEAGVGGCVLLYRSAVTGDAATELRQWEYMHKLTSGAWNGKKTANPCDDGEMWECPEFFALGDPANGGGHVLIYSTLGKVFWQSGVMDERTMTFAMKKTGELDLGAFYAPKTQMDAQGEGFCGDGVPEKRSEAAMKAAGWSGMMALPRVMSLDGDGTLRLRNSAGGERVACGRAEGGGREQRGRRDAAGGERRGGLQRREGQELYAANEWGGGDCQGGVCGARHAFVVDSKEIALQAEDVPRVHAFVDGSVVEMILGERIGVTKRFYAEGAAAGVSVLAESEGESVKMEAWRSGGDFEGQADDVEAERVDSACRPLGFRSEQAEALAGRVGLDGFGVAQEAGAVAELALGDCLIEADVELQAGIVQMLGLRQESIEFGEGFGWVAFGDVKTSDEQARRQEECRGVGGLLCDGKGARDGLVRFGEVALQEADFCDHSPGLGFVVGSCGLLGEGGHGWEDGLRGGFGPRFEFQGGVVDLTGFFGRAIEEVLTGDTLGQSSGGGDVAHLEFQGGHALHELGGTGGVAEGGGGVDGLLEVEMGVGEMAGVDLRGGDPVEIGGHGDKIALLPGGLESALAVLHGSVGVSDVEGEAAEVSKDDGEAEDGVDLEGEIEGAVIVDRSGSPIGELCTGIAEGEEDIGGDVAGTHLRGDGKGLLEDGLGLGIVGFLEDVSLALEGDGDAAEVMDVSGDLLGAAEVSEPAGAVAEVGPRDAFEDESFALRKPGAGSTRLFDGLAGMKELGAVVSLGIGEVRFEDGKLGVGWMGRVGVGANLAESFAGLFQKAGVHLGVGKGERVLGVVGVKAMKSCVGFQGMRPVIEEGVGAGLNHEALLLRNGGDIVERKVGFGRDFSGVTEIMPDAGEGDVGQGRVRVFHYSFAQSWLSVDGIA